MSILIWFLDPSTLEGVMDDVADSVCALRLAMMRHSHPHDIDVVTRVVVRWKSAVRVWVKLWVRAT